MPSVMHPSARVADLLALLLTLKNEFDGASDLYELERKLEVDLDDFMPIVYAANELGFVTIGGGDIIITDLGIEFLSSTLKKRKEIIKNALHRIEPFKTAMEMKEFTLKSLNERLVQKGINDFNSAEGLHGLQILLTEWGVYSGFLKFDKKFEVTA